jgi:hypothetical protein
MKKSARRKTDARRNESTPALLDILWKTFALSSDTVWRAHFIDNKCRKSTVVLPIHSQAATGHGGDALLSSLRAQRSNPVLPRAASGLLRRKGSSQ